MKDLELSLERLELSLSKMNIKSPFDDKKLSNLTHEELEWFSDKLDIMMERKAKDIALGMIFNGRSTKKQKQAIRALAKNEGIRVKRTKRRRFNGNRELVTPEEIDAFKTILYMEGINVSNDAMEKLFE